MAQPLYACRVEDLGPHDRVKVDCWACAKNVGRLTGDFLLRLGLPPYEFVLTIEPRVGCRACGSMIGGHDRRANAASHITALPAFEASAASDGLAE